MKKILFSGCSIAAGLGFDGEHRNPGHYTNLLCDNLFGDDNYQITNIAVPGNSNERIFLDTSTALLRNQYDYAFVCWTSLTRFVFWLGLELYECKRSFVPMANFTSLMPMVSHTSTDIGWTSKQLDDIKNKMLLLNHDHYWIRDIITFVNILINLSKTANTKIYFINNFTPWDNNYFTHNPNIVIPSMLSDYTNKLLNSSIRNAKDTNTLYHMMHNHYNEEGGIREEYWLNLYNSFIDTQIDTAPIINVYPGFKSNKIFAELLADKVKQLNSH